MIIKSLSRKSPSFAQLYDYMNRPGQGDRAGYSFVRNIHAFDPSRDEIIGAFASNASHLRARQGGNILYHEILSIERKGDAADTELREVLYDLAQRYLEERAENLLAYGRLHESDGHFHYHLMISANAPWSPRRHRIDRGRFNQIRRDLETYLLREYPQLRAQPVYTSARPARSRGAVSDAEVQLERRTWEPSKKSFLRAALVKAFAECSGEWDLRERLTREGIELSRRGENFVAAQGRLRCRLRKLGLHEVYTEWLECVTRTRKRLAELAPCRLPGSEHHQLPTEDLSAGRADSEVETRIAELALTAWMAGSRTGPLGDPSLDLTILNPTPDCWICRPAEDLPPSSVYPEEA